MRAALTAPGRRLEIAEVPDPAEPGPGRLQIRVDASGVCGSDLHLVDVAAPGIVLGHEFTGTIVALGPETTGFDVGERIVALPTRSCGRCSRCAVGDSTRCVEGMHFLGGYREGARAPGAFAEFTVVDAAVSLRVPATVSRDHAALTEPLAIALKIVQRAEFGLNDTLAVLGAGPIGLAVVMWAVAQGVGRIVVSDPVASRRALARRVGATAVIDPSTGEPDALVSAELGGAPDVVIECVGRAGMFAQAVALVRAEGRVVVAGMHMGSEEFHQRDAMMRSITVAFSALYTLDHFRHALDALALGRIDPSPLITHRLGLDALPEMIETLRSPNDVGKVLVVP